MSGTAEFIEIRGTDTCPVCAHNGRCKCHREHGRDLITCFRATEDALGYRRLTMNDDCAVFVRIGSPADRPPTERTGTHGGNGQARSETVSTYHDDTAARFARQITQEQLGALAGELGVAENALRRIGVGHAGQYPCFPERDATGHVVGINQRRGPGTDPRYLVRAGDHRGLILPENLAELSEPILLVEGPSDVAACLTMGLAAVGRFNNGGGADLIAKVLRDHRVLVVGENDQKPDSKWPGRDGARRVAQALTNTWGRAVEWALPPAGVKDVRQYLNQHAGDDPQEVGRTLSTYLHGHAEAARPEVQKPAGTYAVIERASDIIEQPVSWLWPNRLELGALNLLASDPGAGKSLLTAAIATAISRGAAWPDSPHDLGRPPRNVVLVTSEDDPSRSTRPRLRVAGADLNRVVIIRSVEERGKRRQLSLQRDLAAIEQALADVGDVALVVIDPLDSYIGRADSNANEEMRAILEPLVGLAERHRVAIWAIKHLNKSTTNPSALHRVAGTMAFVALPRTVAIIGCDRDDSDRKLFMPVKTSHGRKPDALAYRVRQTDDGQPVIEWEPEPVDADADEVLAGRGRRGDRQPGKIDQAEAWLLDALKVGPILSRDLDGMAEAVGVRPGTLQRAREKLREDHRIVALQLRSDNKVQGWALKLSPEGL